jgi:hypothetical protein
MDTVTVSGPPVRSVFPLPSTPETTGTGATACAVRPTSSDRAVDEDPPLLVVALEEIESRRAALERLLEDDLLWRCLV